LLKLARQILQVLSVLAWALWMGGFTFFTSVSLRVAHRVLGEPGEFGFVTQVVTDRLNAIGLVAVTLLGARLAAGWSALRGRGRILLSGTWLILAVTLALLFLQHNQIDALLDFQNRRVLDHAQFQVAHNRYELIATIQWLAAVLHVVALLLSPPADSPAINGPEAPAASR